MTLLVLLFALKVSLRLDSPRHVTWYYNLNVLLRTASLLIPTAAGCQLSRRRKSFAYLTCFISWQVYQVKSARVCFILPFELNHPESQINKSSAELTGFAWSWAGWSHREQGQLTARREERIHHLSSVTDLLIDWIDGNYDTKGPRRYVVCL